ncbi:MAG: hypothetical protein ABIP94_12535, partial [Planctomycetota bacterium]
MVANEPSRPEHVDVDGAQVAAAWAGPSTSTIAALVAATAWSAACVWFVLDAAATRSRLTQMAQASAIDWMPLLATAGAAVLVAWPAARTARGHAAAGLAAAIVLLTATLPEWMPGSGLSELRALGWPGGTWRLVSHAIALGLVFGMLAARGGRRPAHWFASPFQVTTTALAAVVAAAAAMAWVKWHAELGQGTLGVVSLGLTLLALVATGALGTGAAGAGPRARPFGWLLVSLVVLALLWAAAPVGLWRGRGEVDVVVYCAAVAAAAWSLANRTAGIAVGVAAAA